MMKPVNFEARALVTDAENRLMVATCHVEIDGDALAAIAAAAIVSKEGRAKRGPITITIRDAEPADAPRRGNPE